MNDASEEREPLPPVLPPEGVVATRLREIASRAKSLRTGRLDVAGVRVRAEAALRPLYDPKGERAKG